MKRWTFGTLLCLLLGAVTTVVTAWLLAMYTRPWAERGLPPGRARMTQLGVAEEMFGRSEVHNGATQSPIPGNAGFWRLPNADTRTYGWPMFAMKSLVKGQVDASGQLAGGFDLPLTEIVRRGFPTARLPAFLRASDDDRLALIPMWPGFAVNTLIFAVVWIPALWFFEARGRRRARGLCIKCGYDLRGASEGGGGCPECGWGREESDQG